MLENNHILLVQECHGIAYPDRGRVPLWWEKTKLFLLSAFSLPELLVVLVIIGILVLVALPNLMPLISRAKATEAQQQLTFLHSLEQSYFYTYSRYSDDLMELGFEQAQLVIEGGNANYRIEVISADEKGFKAQAVSVVDLDKDGIFNVWEIDQEKKLRESVKD